MALTKIYKVGGVLFVEIADETEPIMIEFAGITSNGDNIVLHDYLGFNSSIVNINVADVRTEANAAIGGQTKMEVLRYIATEMGK